MQRQTQAKTGASRCVKAVKMEQCEARASLVALGALKTKERRDKGS